LNAEDKRGNNRGGEGCRSRRKFEVVTQEKEERGCRLSWPANGIPSSNVIGKRSSALHWR